MFRVRSTIMSGKRTRHGTDLNARFALEALSVQLRRNAGSIRAAGTLRLNLLVASGPF